MAMVEGKPHRVVLRHALRRKVFRKELAWMGECNLGLNQVNPGPALPCSDVPGRAGPGRDVSRGAVRWREVSSDGV
jgi:hypothetical protein